MYLKREVKKVKIFRFRRETDSLYVYLPSLTLKLNRSFWYSLHIVDICKSKMAGLRRHSPTANNIAIEEKHMTDDDDAVIVADDLETEIKHLRGRWELASVLNFLSVFEPVIGSDLKLTAEEIEAALVQPDTSLAQLHIHLLKGIPPVSKTLNGNTWVTALCKKLAVWWPWVAEGEIPLTTANGEEISRYNKLDPIHRLQILKALCEIRANQEDVVSHINDSLKNGTEISCFRKEKIGGDGNFTFFWCDGSPVIGHRLYKEVMKNEQGTKMKGKASTSVPAFSVEWETLATNLEEFKKAADELSSSKIFGETFVGKTVETKFLPLVKTFQKKKERALKRKQMKERLPNDFRSYCTGIIRSSRQRRPVSYTFDEYDRAIDEAIEVTRESGTITKQSKEEHIKQGKETHTENGDSDVGTESKDENIKKTDSTINEAKSDGIHKDSDDDDDYDGKSVDDSDEELCNSGDVKAKTVDRDCFKKPFGSRWSMRLAGAMNHPVAENGNLATRNTLRHRPTRNSALDAVVLDSEDENLSQNTSTSQSIGHEELSSIVADSEEGSEG
ncbi:DDT domain-containing protein DDR4 [Mercurialis annua]|uniref:DDT domain-containing protein DDR4 n=1 Tax=Mercurialis annua TaxID=3986 RepID=UPI00215FB80C|nr:DDT domain-containing protein DDR4 [Mercurialis annua]